MNANMWEVIQHEEAIESLLIKKWSKNTIKILYAFKQDEEQGNCCCMYPAEICLESNLFLSAISTTILTIIVLS